MHPDGALNYDLLVQRACKLAILLLIFSRAAFPQSQSQSHNRPDYDRMDMTCAQILQMSSSDWIAKITAMDASRLDGQIRGMRTYGRCYDERTDRLAASLAKTGKGPLMGARADFRDFDAALKDFTAKALSYVEAPADPGKSALATLYGPVKSAYAALYEKQFRYEFYEEYEAKTLKPMKPTPPAAKPPASATAPGTATPAAPRPGASTAAGAAATTPTTAQARARSDADPVTLAKNRFGKLLEVRPDDKMHELHRAFGDVIGPHHISEATRLAVYRYVIFLLEPPTAAPPSDPPF